LESLQRRHVGWANKSTTTITFLEPQVESCRYRSFFEFSINVYEYGHASSTGSVVFVG
jgi:hypothetical protein